MGAHRMQRGQVVLEVALVALRCEDIELVCLFVDLAFVDERDLVDPQK
jgi:hypothetical protein